MTSACAAAVGHGPQPLLYMLLKGISHEHANHLRHHFAVAGMDAGLARVLAQTAGDRRLMDAAGGAKGKLTLARSIS